MVSDQTVLFLGLRVSGNFFHGTFLTLYYNMIKKVAIGLLIGVTVIHILTFLVSTLYLIYFVDFDPFTTLVTQEVILDEETKVF